ncbi:hypothetical protein [Streptomyces niveus]|uniref:hypothetical protein n=1 Tax=Streptomyces niveus TaxID=193462 RepID=UPI00084C8383|nr:hypothetical protein [Streptomyces niveus]
MTTPEPEPTIRPDAELYVLLRKAGVDRLAAQALIDAHAEHARVTVPASGVQPDTRPASLSAAFTATPAPKGPQSPATARPVPDTERRDRYAKALYERANPGGVPWSSVDEVYRTNYYEDADAAMAVADEEQRDLRADRDNLRVMYDVSEARVHDLIEERDCLRAELEQARRERGRYRSAWTSARERAAAYGEGILRHVEDRETWRRWLKEAETRIAELEQARANTVVCICGHPEQQHFEDACLTCDCGDYLEPSAAREVIARWRTAAQQARATTLDSGAKRTEIRQSYLDLAAQAREDRDFEGEADAAQALRKREEQWAKEDAAEPGGQAEDGAQS